MRGVGVCTSAGDIPLVYNLDLVNEADSARLSCTGVDGLRM
jgi:hypothetical protein